MASVTRVKNTRFALKMSGRVIGQSDSNGAIGWAVYRLSRPKIVRVERGVPIDLLREAARQWTPEDGPFTLYVYETDEAYRGTQGFKTGLGRMEHWIMVGQIAEQLAAEGINVTIMEVS